MPICQLDTEDPAEALESQKTTYPGSVAPWLTTWRRAIQEGHLTRNIVLDLAGMTNTLSIRWATQVCSSGQRTAYVLANATPVKEQPKHHQRLWNRLWDLKGSSTHIFSCCIQLYQSPNRIWLSYNCSCSKHTRTMLVLSTFSRYSTLKMHVDIWSLGNVST